MQIEAREKITGALRAAGINEPQNLGSGLVVQGGTPEHRWLWTTYRGEPLVEVSVATEEEMLRHLDQLAAGLLAHLPDAREHLSYMKSDDWPMGGLFAGWRHP